MQHEYRDIPTPDGEVLKALVKENGCKQWLIVTHGVGEHLGRHQYFLKLFAQQFNILIYDLRGHGRSSGVRGDIRDFTLFRQDIRTVLQYLKTEFSMKEFVLFGHSMGGLVTADYLQNEAEGDFYPQKVFLSAPPVGAPGLMGPLFGNAPLPFLRFLGNTPWSVPLAGLLDLSKLSHDGRVYQSYVSDELVIQKVQVRLFLQILARSRDVFSRPLRAKCPLYVSIGTEDGLVHPGMLIRYFEEVEKNAILKKIEGAYHEIHNEIEKFRAPYFEFLRSSLS